MYVLIYNNNCKIFEIQGKSRRNDNYSQWNKNFCGEKLFLKEYKTLLQIKAKFAVTYIVKN